MKDKVSALLVEMIDVAWKCIQNEKNGYYNMDILGKIGIAVIECKTSMKLNPVNASEIDFIINKIEDRLCSGENLFYYTSFYKVPQVVYRNDPEEFGLLVKKLNIDITSFRIRVAASNIFNFALNASEDDYFFARGHEIIRGFTNAITNDKDELFVPLLYVMLNYFQAVKEYTMCEDNSQQEYALKMGEKCVGFFKYIFDISKYVNMISSNIQLSFFWTALTHEFGLSCISTKEEDFDSRIGDKERWALLSLSKLDNKLFLEIFGTRHSDILNTTYENTSKSILMFRLITTYLFLTNDNDFSNNVINTPMLRFEGTCPYGPEYFLMNYSGIKNQEISAEEMELLNSYDDSQLRQKICSLIVNVDGNELKRQVSKPHGTLEISDLDVKFMYNKYIYYLSMPFKTAREITTNTVSENYAYQIFKPFSHFGNQCLVIFITVKKCSQGLETYIQRMSNKNPDWKVYIIQEKQLAALLKLNNVLN